VRKGKTDGASEEDMDTVIGIHNNMNETTWKQVSNRSDSFSSKLPHYSHRNKFYNLSGDILGESAVSVN
jgi:Cytochrome c/c1 heme lyase